MCLWHNEAFGWQAAPPPGILNVGITSNTFEFLDFSRSTISSSKQEPDSGAGVTSTALPSLTSIKMAVGSAGLGNVAKPSRDVAKPDADLVLPMAQKQLSLHCSLLASVGSFQNFVMLTRASAHSSTILILKRMLLSCQSEGLSQVNEQRKTKLS